MSSTQRKELTGSARLPSDGLSLVSKRRGRKLVLVSALARQSLRLSDRTVEPPNTLSPPSAPLQRTNGRAGALHMLRRHAAIKSNLGRRRQTNSLSTQNVDPLLAIEKAEQLAAGARHPPPPFAPSIARRLGHLARHQVSGPKKGKSALPPLLMEAAWIRAVGLVFVHARLASFLPPQLASAMQYAARLEPLALTLTRVERDLSILPSLILHCLRQTLWDSNLTKAT